MRHNKNNTGDVTKHRAQYESSDVNGKLIFTLLDISHTMRGLYEGRGSQRRVLMVLSELEGPITQRELTERLGIQPGSASEVIAKLESAGLISRSPSESDRRTADIRLTEKGREQAGEAKAQRAQRHIEMFSCLTSEEKSLLLELLEKVNADWEERYAQRLEHHGHHGHHHGREDGHHGRHNGHEGPHQDQNGHRQEGGPRPVRSGEDGHGGCNHDCANCPHPCPKGKARLEGSR